MEERIALFRECETGARIATIPNLNGRRALQIAPNGEWIPLSLFVNAFSPVPESALRTMVEKGWLDRRRDAEDRLSDHRCGLRGLSRMDRVTVGPPRRSPPPLLQRFDLRRRECYDSKKAPDYCQGLEWRW